MLTVKKTLRTIVIAGAASAFLPAALAGDFEIIDTDASGGLSLAEVLAVAPDVTEDEFVTFDSDGTGELSQTEYEEWKASKSDDGLHQDEGDTDGDAEPEERDGGDLN